MAGSDIAASIDAEVLDHVVANHPSYVQGLLSRQENRDELAARLAQYRTMRDAGIDVTTGQRDESLAAAAMQRIATASTTVPGARPTPEYVAPHEHRFDRVQVEEALGLEVWGCTICGHQAIHLAQPRVARNEARRRRQEAE